MIGAGSFGTAVAVLLARGPADDAANAHAVIEGLEGRGLPPRAAIISLAKGLVPPESRRLSPVHWPA